MGRRKLPAYTGIEVEDIALGGKALARKDDLVIFIEGAVPGDVVDVQVTRKKRNYQEARVTAYHTYSEKRTTPFCRHFGTCGGCKWQHLPYEQQLHYKQKQVYDALERLGKLNIEQKHPILGSAKTRYYRNKLEYTFSNHRWLNDEEIRQETEFEHRNGLGFHVPGRFDRVVDVHECFLQEDPSNKIRNTLREFALKEKLTFYDHHTNEGLLRNLIIRTSTLDELMVILSVQYDEPVVYRMLEHLDREVPGITSLMYTINPKKNETLYDLDIQTFRGRDHIVETLDGLTFKIGPKSFFQTNSYQALNLYRVAREFAGLSGTETVYDLYTGTGTIANYMAPSARHVIGIESVPEAIEDARVNAGLNKLDNTSFFAGDMKDLFTGEFIAANGRPDVLITDPPRAGMHPKVVERIIEAGPPRIVYVSCNPATQARDAALLSEHYHIRQSQPVDMFPHTPHIENVLLMERS